MINTETTSEQIFEFEQLCQKYLTALYQGVSGFISYQAGEKETGEKSKVFLTYGEILYPSVELIIHHIQSKIGITKNDVLYDLGSGVGKVPLHFFLKTPVKKAMGIEASEKRHHLAEKVYHQVKQEFPELFEGGRQLESKTDNFLTADILDATIIYTCSTCFNEELLADMGLMMDKLPNLRCIVSLKALPLKMPLESVLEIECTWDKTKCYVYMIPTEGVHKD